MPDTEPDKYSIDEMMQRLKSRSGHAAEGEPQFVTRPDGSQVIKVRKRKRRSHQPHKEAEKRRRRRTLVTVSVMMLLVMAGVLGFIGWVFYLNSGAYRDKVATRLGAWTGAGLEMRKFRATPVSASAESLEITWPPEVPAARLKLDFLHADLRVTSHLTGTWTGRGLEAGSGQLVLRAVSDPRSVRPPEGPLPFQIPVRVDALDILFGEGERAAFGIYKAEAALTVADPGQPEANVVVKNGVCRISDWGRFDVKLASLLLSGGDAYVGMIRIAPEGDQTAEFQIFGEGFPAIPAGGGEAELRLKVRSMPSLPLLGPGLGAFLDGNFETLPEDGTGRIRLDPVRLETLAIDVPVRGTLGPSLTFRGLPMFTILADQLDNARFREPRFDSESSFRVARTADRVTLEELDLVAEGMLRLRGTIEEGENGRLSGVLETGIAESYFEAPGSSGLARVFERVADGYRWATVELSGTTKAPADDLDVQLVGSRGGGAALPGGGGVRDPEEEFFDLTTPE